MQCLWNFAQGVKLIFLNFGFARGFEIHFPSFARLVKFRTECEIHFPKSCSLSCSLYSFWHFASLRKFSTAMRNCWMLDSFSDSLPCILDWFGKGYEALQNWILHVIELQLALPWTTQSSPSFLARFNYQKAIKNTKTCQKLIRNICKGL